MIRKYSKIAEKQPMSFMLQMQATLAISIYTYINNVYYCQSGSDAHPAGNPIAETETTG